MPYYDAAGSHILHFGQGDIRISHGTTPETGKTDELVFMLGKAGTVGDWHPGTPGETTNERNCPVRMIFDSAESLDVLIEQAQALRYILSPLDAPAYFLDQDQSSHWYIVPRNHEGEWRSWCELDETDPKAWDAPRWAVRLGSGPNSVNFNGFSVEGQSSVGYMGDVNGPGCDPDVRG